MEDTLIDLGAIWVFSNKTGQFRSPTILRRRDSFRLVTPLNFVAVSQAVSSAGDTV